MKKNTKHYDLKMRLLAAGEAEMQFTTTTPMLKWRGNSILYLEPRRVTRALHKWAHLNDLRLKTQFDRQSRILTIRVVNHARRDQQAV